MRLEHYISNLLYRYQCVTVPGFGAFISEWQSAQIIEGQNSFIPPRKLISFNSNIKTNDGLLANHISLQEKISYENALDKIQSHVSFWLEKLNHKESLLLENIGEIINNIENNLVFIPNNSINYLTDSFGLTGFNSPNITREVVLEKTNEIPVVNLPSIEEKVIKLQPSIQKTAASVVTKKKIIAKKQPKNNWVKYAAAIAVFGTVGTFAFRNYYENTVNTNTILVQKAVQEKLNKKIQEATFVLPNPIDAVDLSIENIDPATKPYHVVGGAYRTVTNAKKGLNELISKGFNAHLLKKNKSNLIPVAFESFIDYNEAQKLKASLIKQGYPDVWVLID